MASAVIQLAADINSSPITASCSRLAADELAKTNKMKMGGKMSKKKTLDTNEYLSAAVNELNQISDHHTVDSDISWLFEGSEDNLISKNVKIIFMNQVRQRQKDALVYTEGECESESDVDMYIEGNYQYGITLDMIEQYKLYSRSLGMAQQKLAPMKDLKIEKGKVVVTQIIETPYYIEYDIVSPSLWAKAQEKVGSGNRLTNHLACGLSNDDVSKFGLKLTNEQEDTPNREINNSKTSHIEKVK